ncbi:alginate export family protein [Chromatocurvus halotolerans]|nr:alginate export family protein [Chromatocurvus halotolerans]
MMMMLRSVLQRWRVLILTLLVCSGRSGALVAAESRVADALSLAADFRYRAESVDLSGAAEDALASTLRSRLTLTGKPATGWSWVVEVDDVRVIGAERYNSTGNGQTHYPIVADPEGTDLNRAALAWHHTDVSLRAGRQRIVHGSERFVGGVAWRQNEQTYDGLRGQWQLSETASLDMSYVGAVRRIFGPDDGAQPASWDGDSLFLRAVWQPTDDIELRPFAYRLDVNADADFGPALTVDNSTDTVGIEADWSVGPLTLRGAYARQWEHGDSTLDYAANYSLAQGIYRFGAVQVEIAREVLGSDSNTGFRTPLATLHKFQGWADVFLTTPADGIEDTSLAFQGSVEDLTWRVVGHRFEADRGDAGYGHEFDLDVSWQMNERLSFQFRFAVFDADSAAARQYRDVRKAWFIARLALP